jgi:hypothetical protein
MGDGTGKASEQPQLTYREQAVEEELDDHDRRISRLEKALLIAVGYVLADQNVLLDPILGLLL